jgi:diguanylate cyclase (GGDEF)-like protein/PAS domain S-box-containing protein
MTDALDQPPPPASPEVQDPAEALRISEERLTLVARATTDTVWDWNVRTNALWWGGRFREVLGLPHYTKVPHTDAFVARLHPEDRERVVSSLQATVHGSADTWECEYRIRHEDGHYLWMLDRGFVIRDAQGQALRMVGGMADISERKLVAQEEAQEAQVHAELVRVQQSISSLELGLPEVLQHVAQTALDICQAEGALLELLEGDQLVAQAAVGQLVRTPGSALPLHSSLLWPELSQGRPVLCNDTAAQGWNLGDDPLRQQVRSVLAAPLVCDDTVVGTLKATSSRTDSFSPRHLAHLQILAQSLGAMLRLRQVAAQLRESEQQYKLLFDMHPQPMWVRADDPSLRFLAVNQAMQAQYGYSAQELLRMGMADLWLPEERAQRSAEVRNYPHDQAHNGLLHRHRRKDGSVCEMEISSRGIVFNGQPARQVMATDVTERQQTQRELSRLARAQSMLSSCNEALVRATSEATLLQEVCRMLVEMGGYRLGWVGFAQNDAQRSIQIVAHAGEGSDYLEQLNPSWSEHHPRGQGPVGLTVRSGHSVIVRDVASTTLQADWADRMVGQGFHGVMALPLRAAGHTFGLLYLYAPEVLLIGSEEEALMQQLADDLAFGIMSLRARREQQQLQASVLKMAAAVSATTGAEFFVQLARNMGEALEAQVACVARLVSGRQKGDAPRLLALALVVDGKLSDSVEYSLDGTPSMELLQHKQYVVPSGLLQRYPQAPIVQQVQAQGYAGQQLVDASGKPTGMIFVLFRQPLANADFVATTLQIFATRAGAEIERQATDVRVRHQASLLDKAQDAIVERDLQHRIIYWNQGAERLYGWSAAQAQGRQADTLMYGDNATFEHATTKVLTRGEWSGEISVRHQDGHTIEAEGRWTLVLDDKGRPESILEINTDIRQRKAKDREIQRLAFYDTLTGLPNRMLLLDRMQHALDNAIRQHQGGALLFIDLDNFKTLNDTLGHDKGDLLLQQVAQRLNTCVRSVDTVARLGGDEFVVMLEGLSADAQALVMEARGVGEKILTQLGQPYALAGYHYRSTPSIGIVPFLGPQTSVQAGRSGHVPGQIGRAQHAALFRPGNAGGGERPCHPGRRPAPCAGVRAVFAAFPTAGGPERPLCGSGGTGALAPPRARPGFPRKVHTGGRGNRPDSGAGALGAALGLQAAGPLEGRPATEPLDDGGQRELATVPQRELCGRRSAGPGGQRGASRPAQAGTDRKPDGGRRGHHRCHHDHAAQSGGALLAGRLWHRLFQPELPQAHAAGPDQDRPELCARPVLGPERRGHHQHHHRPGPDPGAGSDCRGRGNHRAAPVAGQGRMPGLPGLSVQQAHSSWHAGTPAALAR